MSVLVIGSTGIVGPHVVRALRARGVHTRVFTRDPQRALRLLPEGTDIRCCTPHLQSSLLDAADGLDAAFLLTPDDPRSTDIQLEMIRVLRRTGVRIVKVSGTTAAVTPDGPEATRRHWEVEQVLTHSGQPFVVLRPCTFMQFLIDRIVLPILRDTGKVIDPLGPAGINYIDARDIGECGAEALMDPRWVGHTLALTGPRAVTFDEIAEQVGARIGRTVETVKLTPWELRRQFQKRGMAWWEADHFRELFGLFRQGLAEPVSPDVDRLIGRRPTGLDEYLRTHAAFESADTIAAWKDTEAWPADGGVIDTAQREHARGQMA
ncbi:NmrA family NAD(P)-binding protein [Pseudonocardia alaniniphila]|uniref:NmrA family NAD(P)-binding protein n=1 Tax=Pseudonocardia alaniniphila TaxID=75291 RepID=A0ABS9TK59_9PSEU|nr:NmrA family NAD(P)-binding protein [Pseudonocardia alaniniphila]MCH6168919.1 NmrA family NAD(P)-binding protein [Pseudonocardia alaniniphila]